MNSDRVSLLKPQFNFFSRFSTPGPVLTIFPPPSRSPFAIQVNQAQITVGSKNADLTIDEPDLPETIAHICRQAVQGAELSISADFLAVVLLNGIQLPGGVPVALRSGDVLGVGGWQVKVLTVAGEEATFEGDLNRIPIFALLQVCSTYGDGKSTLVSVHHRNKVGKIFFLSGKVIHSEFLSSGGQVEGMEAFRRILQFTLGRFSILRDSTVPKNRTLDASLDALFLATNGDESQTQELTFEFSPNLLEGNPNN